MAESSSPFSKPISGNIKPIMGGENTYSKEEWNNLSEDFEKMQKTLRMGSREAVVSIAKFLCDLSYKVPYSNFKYQQQYDKNYAVYPYVGLNTDWGEKYVLKNGQKLPPQGMYCSAFVEWVFINAGIDYNFKLTTDARLYGGKVMSTKKAFLDGLIKAGDTIHTSQARSKTGRMFNHIGIVIEVCKDYILVAEMRPMMGLVVTKASGNFSRLNVVVVESNLYK